MTEKNFLKLCLRSCISSYFDPVTHRMNDDAYDKSGNLQGEYRGSVEDFMMFETHAQFSGGNERGYTWYANWDGKKYFGITIRGTYNMLGWALNFAADKDVVLDFEPWGSPTKTGVAVHAGFHFGVKEIFDEILKRTKLALEDGYDTIVVTGHSRGAAIAQGVAVGLQKILTEQEHIGIKIKARVFASPNYFNPAGAESYNRRVPDTIRIKNGSDPVTNTPPVWMGFSPVGKEILIGQNILTTLSPANWLVALTQYIPVAQVVGVGASMISSVDHFPMRYMRGLEKLK